MGVQCTLYESKTWTDYFDCSTLLKSAKKTMEVPWMEAILRLAASQTNIKVSVFFLSKTRLWKIKSWYHDTTEKANSEATFLRRLDNLFFPRPSCPIDGAGRYCLRLLNPEKNDIWGLNKSRFHLLPNPRSLVSPAWPKIWRIHRGWSSLWWSEWFCSSWSGRVRAGWWVVTPPTANFPQTPPTVPV